MTNAQLLLAVRNEYKLKGESLPDIEVSEENLMLHISDIDLFFEIINNISDNIKITGIWQRGFNIKLKYKKSYEKRT